MEKFYTVRKTRQGADCGSDHELLIAEFRLKFKKVGKTTRPFKYDLNQISNLVVHSSPLLSTPLSVPPSTIPGASIAYSSLLPDLGEISDSLL